MNICVDNTGNLLAAWLNETSVICGFSAYKTINAEQILMRSISNSTAQAVYFYLHSHTVHTENNKGISRVFGARSRYLGHGWNNYIPQFCGM